MIIQSLSSVRTPSLLYQLDGFVKHAKIFLKLEGVNLAGSIKLKTACHLIRGLESRGEILPGRTKLIESSSGNLGVALAMICKEKNYSFTCVTDPNISPISEKYMRLYGANLIKVSLKDTSGGYLTTRINLIRKMVLDDPTYLWTNQYANEDNPKAHYMETAVEILEDLPKVDYLVIGAGTTGTLMGCAKYFRTHSPETKIIAVDSVGSVTFNRPPRPRFIPGLGTSRRPELVDEKYLHRIIMVPEEAAIKMCRYILNRYGLFLGGSTGSVLAAIKSLSIPSDAIVVTVSPDLGNKYLDTVYNDKWCKDKFSIKNGVTEKQISKKLESQDE